MNDPVLLASRPTGLFSKLLFDYWKGPVGILLLLVAITEYGLSSTVFSSLKASKAIYEDTLPIILR